MPDLASYQPTVQPIAPGRDARTTVLLSGLATTALALVGVYLLSTSTDDFNIMGWYADYVLPVGPLIVGFVAASGYGIASWRTGQKITRSLLWTVLALQVVAYFAGQYIEFHSLGLQYKDGTPVSFLTYFDFAARSFSWQQDDGSAGSPLGLWGYGLRLLEIAGFCGGSLAVPLILRAVPYCESCQSYMKTKEAGLLPASVPSRKVKKSDATAQASYDVERQEAWKRGGALTAAITERAAAGDFDGYRALLAEHLPQKRQIEKLPSRIALSVVRCPKCSGGFLKTVLRTGHGKQIEQKELGRHALTPTFVRVVTG
jgi:hypothetical protein